LALRSLQRSPRPSSWNIGDLLLRKGKECREGEGKERMRKGGKKRGRGGKRGEGETRHTNPSLLTAPPQTAFDRLFY